MYRIVSGKKVNRDYDYTFKDFNSFYKIADVMTVPIRGRYKVGIITDDVVAVKDFIKVEARYSYMMIYIHLSDTLVDRLAMENLNLPIEKEVKPFDLFKQIVSRRRLLFAKGVLLTMYSSIEHTDEAMEEAVDCVYNAYGSDVEITEKMLAEVLIINKTVYPRSVLVAYIYMERFRDKKLEKCLRCVGNDVALGACIKNIKKIQEEKAKYFKTGQGSNFIKSLNTQRVNMMYRTLVVDRGRIKDLTLLLAMYERGIENDFI